MQKQIKIIEKYYKSAIIYFMYNMSDTIVAVSTGTGAGAISIVRMSGKDAVKIADKFFVFKNNEKPSSFEPRKLMLGTLETETFNEQAMCVVFRAPYSYTGEDLVEFQCHGGNQIAHGICKECVKLGARPATNGEFTKRAFLNGKTTLSSAEGMMDMINAESDAEIRAGYALLSGNLSKLATDAQKELTDILAELEVSFDYPEETIEFITKSNIKTRITKLTEEIRQVLSTCKTGNIIKNGINILIVGKPNVGKSSLLNSLLQRERAIVTDVAGTTRDSLEETFMLGDFKINLIDTAGIHTTDDKVEKIGVEKAKSYIGSADIILFILDMSREYSREDEEIFDEIKNKNFIVVKAKSDLEDKLNKKFDNEVEISNLTQSGIEELKNKIIDACRLSNIPSDSVIITNERHKNALERTLKSLENVLAELQDETLDLISIDIKEAYDSIGEITGNTTSENIIDSIFDKFCLGK